MTSLANRRPRRSRTGPDLGLHAHQRWVPSFLHARYTTRYTHTHVHTRAHTESRARSSVHLALTHSCARALPKYVGVSVSLGIATVACFSGARANKYPCGRLQGGLMELIKMCSINRTAACPPSSSSSSSSRQRNHPLRPTTLSYTLGYTIALGRRT